MHLLLSLGGDRLIDVRVSDEELFRNACFRGHEGVVRQLLSLPPERGQLHLMPGSAVEWVTRVVELT